MDVANGLTDFDLESDDVGRVEDKKEVSPPCSFAESSIAPVFLHHAPDAISARSALHARASGIAALSPAGSAGD
ncbi:MAG: hypothetical protein R3C56_19725 [Pirellulaceae bacterium]